MPPISIVRSDAKGCRSPGCRRAVQSDGVCASCAPTFRIRTGERRKPAECVVEGCIASPRFSGLCRDHFIVRHGYDPRPEKPKAKRKYARGGSYFQNGYRFVYVEVGYPGAKPSSGRKFCWVIAEHRKVMQEMLGRVLSTGENVHHINGLRDDNRPENLELWVVSQPCGQRLEEKLSWARAFVARYGTTGLGL